MTSLSPRPRSDRKRVMSARAYCFLTVRTASARMAVSRTSFDPEVWSRRYHFVVLQSCRPRSVLLLYRTSCSLYLPMALPLASYQFFALKLLLRTLIRTQAAMWVSYQPYQARGASFARRPASSVHCVLFHTHCGIAASLEVPSVAVVGIAARLTMITICAASC